MPEAAVETSSAYSIGKLKVVNNGRGSGTGR